MTTGSWTHNFQYVQSTPLGGAGYVGRKRIKTWSGTDAINKGKPRWLYKELPRGPQRLTHWTQYRFALRRWRRDLPPQPYTMTAEDTTIGIIRWRYRGEKTSRFSFLGATDPWGGMIPPVDPVYDYRAIARLRSKAYGSGFNPAVFTVEGHMAIKMVGTAAQRLRLGFTALAAGDLRGVFLNFRIPTDRWAHAKGVVHRFRRGKLVAERPTLTARDGSLTFSGALLELRYGWLPLIGDMERGAQYLGHQLTVEGQPGRLKTRVRWTVIQDRAVDRNEIGFTQRVLKYELTYLMRAARKTPAYLPSLHLLTTAAWERLPWSFVYDWVVPIGSYLEACRTADDLVGEVVRSLKVTAICSQTSVRGGSNTVYEGVWWESVHRKKVQFTRTVTKELDPPKPLSDVRSLGDFGKKFSLSLVQSQNALALLTQYIANKAPSIKHALAHRGVATD